MPLGGARTETGSSTVSVFAPSTVCGEPAKAPGARGIHWDRFVPPYRTPRRGNVHPGLRHNFVNQSRHRIVNWLRSHGDSIYPRSRWITLLKSWSERTEIAGAVELWTFCLNFRQCHNHLI